MDVSGISIMENKAVFNDFIQQHRQKFPKASLVPPILSPTMQHSGLGVHGGMGDFILQSAQLYPNIEWVVPLTRKIRDALKKDITQEDFVGSLPVTLYDPVLGTPFIFDIDFYCHINPANNSLSWLIYNKSLLEPVLDLELKNQSIYAGLGAFKGIDDLLTLNNTPLLKQVHPLLRRYVSDPDYINMICQCAFAKAMAQFLSINHEFYKATWVHDWHFSALAGELLLTGNQQLIDNITYIQYMHNALYQGNSNNHDLVNILGWPKHFFTTDFFNIHGQLNLLGGALNIIKNSHLVGKVATVSKNHAKELTTVERGAGLDVIFEDLDKVGRLTGINNPIVVPPGVLIKTPEDIANKKPGLKQDLQKYFGLPVDEHAFTLLWSHRFTQQKQVTATLRAIEKILSLQKLNIQFMFFSDINIGSSAKDVDKLEQLIERYPRQVAKRSFQPEMEMAITAGADCSIMASFFEPFGYAPVWVALQGGVVITAKNGGQVNIFGPDQAIWLDILSDVDVSNVFKRYSLNWFLNPSLWFANNKSYHRRVVRKNSQEIYRGILKAGTTFSQDRKGWQLCAKNSQQRIMQLVKNNEFGKEIIVLLNYPKTCPAIDANQEETKTCVNQTIADDNFSVKGAA